MKMQDIVDLFEPNIVFNGHNKGSAVCVTHFYRGLAVLDNGSLFELPLKKVVSVDIVRSDVTNSKTTGGLNVTRAAIGGVLFGGAGLVTGGLSGDKKTVSRQSLSKLRLRIAFEISDRVETVSCTFFDASTGSLPHESDACENRAENAKLTIMQLAAYERSGLIDYDLEYDRLPAVEKARVDAAVADEERSRQENDEELESLMKELEELSIDSDDLHTNDEFDEFNSILNAHSARDTMINGYIEIHSQELCPDAVREFKDSHANALKSAMELSEKMVSQTPIMTRDEMKKMNEEAIEIASKRLARGEISEADYQTALSIIQSYENSLRETDPEPSPSGPSFTTRV